MPYICMGEFRNPWPQAHPAIWKWNQVWLHCPCQYEAFLNLYFLSHIWGCNFKMLWLLYHPDTPILQLLSIDIHYSSCHVVSLVRCWSPSPHTRSLPTLSSHTVLVAISTYSVLAHPFLHTWPVGVSQRRHCPRGNGAHRPAWQTSCPPVSQETASSTGESSAMFPPGRTSSPISSIISSAAQ